MLTLGLLNKQQPPFISQAWGSDGQEILVGHVKPQKVFCGTPLELFDFIEKCLLFDIFVICESRFHCCPSLKEVWENLRKMKEHGWINQTIQTQVRVLPSACK